MLVSVLVLVSVWWLVAGSGVKRGRSPPSMRTVPKNIACGLTHHPVALYSGR